MTWAKTKDPRIKKRGQFYWARFGKKGYLVQESLGTRSFATAVRVCDDIEECLLRGVSWRKTKDLFETAWPDFLSDKAKGIKTKIARPKTLREYIGFGERVVLPHLGKYRVCDFDEEKWEWLVAEIRKEKPNILFFNPRKYLMGFLSWAKRKGKITEVPELYNPDKKPMGFDEDTDDEVIERLYSKDELRRLRDGLDKNGEEVFDFKGLEAFRLWILMGQFMGMRSSEITQLHKNRINIQTRTIALRARDTKTGDPRTVPIHNTVLKPILAQIKASDKSPYLFPNRWDKKRPMDQTGFKKPWNALREATGIEGRFHDFKHSFITHALNDGMNPVIVSRIVGTSLRVIEKVYLHLQPKDLVNGLNRLRL